MSQIVNCRLCGKPKEHPRLKECDTCYRARYRDYQRAHRAKNAVPRDEPEGPYPCFFGCGKSLETKYNQRAISGWEWFTGYGVEPVHFCPQCAATKPVEIENIRERLNVRPPNYPQERASPDGDSRP